MTEPTVSVVIPAYNAERWLGEAVRSVQAQTMTEWELIIVNDGSSDDTSKVARAFGDERVRVIDKPNGGVSSARNTGLDLAKGVCIAFLDADDAMEPTNLAEKYNVLRNEAVEWVFGDLLLCDPNMASLDRVLKGTDGDVVRTILLGIEPAVPASCSNALLKRACFDSGFRFDTELSNAADQHFSLFMARHFRYAHLPKALNRYRVLSDSMSRNVDLYAADHIRLMHRAVDMGLLNDPAMAREVWSNAYWSIGGSYWKNAGTPLKAVPYLIRSILRDPRVLMRRLKRS
jgi:glycosyltransferase involved in cell wall biosynthesis